MTVQKIDQFISTIQNLCDVTSRVDERSKILLEKQNALEDKLSELLTSQQDLLRRIIVIESLNVRTVFDKVENLSNKVQELEFKSKAAEVKNNRIFKVLSGVIVGVVVALVIWMMNIK